MRVNCSPAWRMEVDPDFFVDFHDRPEARHGRTSPSRGRRLRRRSSSDQRTCRARRRPPARRNTQVNRSRATRRAWGGMDAASRPPRPSALPRERALETLATKDPEPEGLRPRASKRSRRGRARRGLGVVGADGGEIRRYPRPHRGHARPSDGRSSRARPCSPSLLPHKGVGRSSGRTYRCAKRAVTHRGRPVAPSRVSTRFPTLRDPAPRAAWRARPAL